MNAREAAAVLGRLGGASTQAGRTPEERTRIGRLGGLKGGAARARLYSKYWQSENGRRAAAARWGLPEVKRLCVLGVWL